MSATFEDQVSYISRDSPTYTTPSAIIRVAEYFNSLKQRRESIILRKRQNREHESPTQSASPGKKNGRADGKSIPSVSSDHSSIVSHFRPRKRQHGTLTLRLNDSESTISAENKITEERNGQKSLQEETLRNKPLNKFMSMFSRMKKNQMPEKGPSQEPLSLGEESEEKDNNTLLSKSYSFKLFGSFSMEKRKAQKYLDDLEEQWKIPNNASGNSEGRTSTDKRPYVNQNFSPVRSFKNDLVDKDKIPTSITAFSRLFVKNDPMRSVFDKKAVKKEKKGSVNKSEPEITPFYKVASSPRPKSNSSIDFTLAKLLEVQNHNSTESAQLENKIFSPNSHRPSLVDVPSIDRLNSHGLADLTFDSSSSDNEMNDAKTYALKEDTSHPVLRENGAQTKLGTRLSKVFGSGSSDANSPSDMELFTASSHSNFSGTLQAIKEKLHKKPKSNISRGTTKRGSFHVRFLSPRLSSIRLFRSEEALAKPAHVPHKLSSVPDLRMVSKLDVISDDFDGDSLSMGLLNGTSHFHRTRSQNEASNRLTDSLKFGDVHSKSSTVSIAKSEVSDTHASGSDRQEDLYLSNRYLDYIDS